MRIQVWRVGLLPITPATDSQINSQVILPFDHVRMISMTASTSFFVKCLAKETSKWPSGMWRMC